MNSFNSNSLLSIGTTTGVLYKILENVSEVARLLLPILSCLSFVIYVIINWDNIKGWAKKIFFRKKSNKDLFDIDEK